ncbi:tRNA pseudouridine(38-40) synthase TruA [Nafulsella turpanensis]|uniref:tRNA pseudouridine(38-40) synthase TruA n=1 Tax=Nafulsella turpanensis TaxID=1265690 RepID=UPI00034ACCA2|nr:tRNA pseudouridine(38-40) synthase TruA [Nafulsella turpanensis]
MRYFLDVAYNGTHYHGWQVQQNANTVQAELEGALSKLLRTPIAVVGSGRTDTGVHAEQQLVHLDWDAELDVEQLHFRLNKLLPSDIAVKRIFPVHPKAHARFSALFRSYEYRISRQKNPFLQKLTYVNGRPLDVEAMNKAAEFLLQWEDFECFSKVHTEVKHFRCNIQEARWIEEGDMLVFYIRANRFLRNMVRAIVGTLLEVGQHRMSREEFRQVLESRDRSRAGRSAPAQGLFLTKVTYPDKIYELSDYESDF